MKLKLPSSAPPCPNCRSTNTDRLPFEAKNQAFPARALAQDPRLKRQHESSQRGIAGRMFSAALPSCNTYHTRKSDAADKRLARLEQQLEPLVLNQAWIAETFQR